MIKFKAKDVKKRGHIISLSSRGDDEAPQFVVVLGNRNGEGEAQKMQAYCLATSRTKGPVILEQTRGSIPAFNALVSINRALTKWHNSNGGAKGKELEELTRQRVKAIMRIAKLLNFDDLVADRTEFEAHFG